MKHYQQLAAPGTLIVTVSGQIPWETPEVEISIRRLTGESCGDEGCRAAQRDLLNRVTLATEASAVPQGSSGAGGLVSDVTIWVYASVPLYPPVN